LILDYGQEPSISPLDIPNTWFTISYSQQLHFPVWKANAWNPIAIGKPQRISLCDRRATLVSIVILNFISRRYSKCMLKISMFSTGIGKNYSKANSKKNNASSASNVMFEAAMKISK
jgi:hypothetical protein